MVRKLIPALLLIALSLPLFASGADVSITGGVIKRGNTDALITYAAEVTPYYTFSDQNLKGELRGDLILNDTMVILSLKRADFRFRLPSFGGKKVTLTAGRSPISWGLGSYYRIGDVLLDGMSSNKKAGVSDSRNVWLVSASQSMGSGFTLEAAAVLPIPSTVTFTQAGSMITQGEKAAIGAKLKKSLDTKTLKAVQLSASYSEDKVTSLAAAFDASLWFDITGGAETKFRSGNDIRAAVNMTKFISLEGETVSVQLGLYLAGEFDFFKKEYQACTAFSLTPTERLTLYLAITNSFSEGGYSGLDAYSTLSFTISDSVRAEAAFGYTHNEDAFTGMLTLKSAF